LLKRKRKINQASSLSKVINAGLYEKNFKLKSFFYIKKIKPGTSQVVKLIRFDLTVLGV